ncbi:TniQ family protein [Paraburkholderia sp. RL18-085-BIA-A]|uniref:TniQ family protein n=1 Tax=Paraburkholderia sp. RL18-085-BIA-A TaxID=3031633 RepID=UPI0038B9B5D8
MARIGRFATKGKLPRARVLPSGLGKYADELLRYVGSRDSVRERNSLIPLVLRTMRAEHKEKVVNHFFEKNKGGLMSFFGLNGPGSEWTRVPSARCPRCIVEDITPGNQSLPFWRREHLIPGLLMCSRHKMPLHTTCEGCADFSQFEVYGVHPAAHCGCGLRPLPQASKLVDGDVDAEIELARISACLLNSDYMPAFRRERIAYEVARAVKGHGLTTFGRIRWERTLEFFRDSPDARLLERVNLVTELNHGFRQVLNGASVLRHPLQCIALLKALHGTWTAVEQAFASPVADEATYPAAPSEAKPSRSKTRDYHIAWRERHFARWSEHYRKMYRELRTANPRMGHMQLMRQMPANARFFISKQFLLEAGEDVSHLGSRENVPRERYYEELDESMSAHVAGKARLLIEDGFRRQLTETVLLRGHRKYRTWESIKHRMPSTREALDKHVETLAAFRERIPVSVSRPARKV